MDIDCLTPPMNELQTKLLLYSIENTNSTGEISQYSIDDFKRRYSIAYQNEDFLSNDIESMIRLSFKSNGPKKLSITKLVSFVEYDEKNVLIEWNHDIKDFIQHEKEKMI